MASYFEVPAQPFVSQQREKVSLLGTVYMIVMSWNEYSGSWVVDVYDSSGNTPILCGVPVVTGTDLLGQYEYLSIGSKAVLMAVTIAVGTAPDEVPTFENFGVDGHLYYVTA